ncbi:hypothetical protein A5636_01890 [Mycobacterium asiaticum]|uniref:Uncharacterized protein n=1 Tax=Mycobacterium asiaticum TaxID=1790 RepID=A0A1A3NA37_MYCAS|nr:hypothetical protein A5636_01890 [Mycobacterium asiaticum]
MRGLVVAPFLTVLHDSDAVLNLGDRWPGHRRQRLTLQLEIDEVFQWLRQTWRGWFRTTVLFEVDQLDAFAIAAWRKADIADIGCGGGDLAGNLGVGTL